MTKKVRLDENIEIGFCKSNNNNCYIGDNINNRKEIPYEETFELKRKNKIQINSNQVCGTTTIIYRNDYEINNTTTKKKSFINKMVELERENTQISPRSQPLQPQQSIAIQFSKLFI